MTLKQFSCQKRAHRRWADAGLKGEVALSSRNHIAPHQSHFPLPRSPLQKLRAGRFVLAGYLLLTAYCLLLTAYGLLLTAYGLRLTSPPIAEHLRQVEPKVSTAPS